MRVAIAVDGDLVSNHFGHCQTFQIYEVEKGDILHQFTLANPGHVPGYLPVFLAEKSVCVLITGGIGSRAQALFAEQNIQTVTGASGNPRDVLHAYLKGTLVEGHNCCDH